jgi:hypothetical protein
MFSEEAVVLTKATIRVSDRLAISQKVLALVLGLSESTISRMRKGSFLLERGSNKAFELAQLLVRLHNLLDLIVAGDEAAARAWLTAENSTLQGRPMELIQRVQGLANVISYLEARRSLS